MSETFISGTRYSGPNLIIEFGPKGIDGICVVGADTLNRILRMHPNEMFTFLDEQHITWRVEVEMKGIYIYFKSLGLHGLRGRIPVNKVY